MAICSLYIEDALPSTSRCTCRLNNVHTYQENTFTISHCHMLILRAAFTDPMFDVSFSCTMLCHPRRYRYVKCTQARRPSPCRATWMAAHARVADASKRAPLIDSSGSRSQCWSRSKRTPLTGRVATRDPRRLSHKVPNAPQEGAHICSCAEYLLEQLERVHRQ